jgi:hypothetical protein
MIGLIRDAESSATLRAAEVGEPHTLYNITPEIIAEHAAARNEWSKLSDLRDTLQAKLGIKGGSRVKLGKYAQLIRDYAAENGEKVLNKFTNINDVALSNLLSQKFPSVAASVKDYQLNQILKTVSKNAPEGQSINANKFFDQIGRLSPEARANILPPQSVAKLQDIQRVLNRFKALDADRNFSNTAPTLMRLIGKAGGTLTSLLSMITGHNPIASAVIGGVADQVGKHGPDAAKLSLIQFLSKNEPVNAAGYRAMSDYIENAHQGNQALNKAIHNIFVTGSVPATSILRNQTGDKR